jgi:hypothetical protein
MIDTAPFIRKWRLPIWQCNLAFNHALLVFPAVNSDVVFWKGEPFLRGSLICKAVTVRRGRWFCWIELAFHPYSHPVVSIDDEDFRVYPIYDERPLNGLVNATNGNFLRKLEEARGGL